jgi:hypothetical protein
VTCKGIKEPPMIEKGKKKKGEIKKQRQREKKREIFTWNEYAHEVQGEKMVYY